MGVFEDLEAALKRVIPTSSLPMNYATHSVLAHELVLELSGTVVMLDKKQYDRHLRRMANVRRAEESIKKGLG